MKKVLSLLLAISFALLSVSCSAPRPLCRAKHGGTYRGACRH